MHALRTLEWGAVQALLAGHCHTSYAQSEALGLIPSFEKEAVETLIGQTREGFELLGSHSINLAGVKDVERDVKRAQKGGVLDGSTLHTVGTSVRSMREAKSILELHAQQFSLLWELGVQLLVESRLETRILSSVDGDGHVGDEASRELASIRQKVALTAKKAQERIQSYVSGRTRDLLSDSVVTTRSGRYVVPLKVENKGKIKGIVHDTSASGSTLYIEPDDVVAIGNELRSLEAAERAEVARILAALSSDVGKVADELIRGLQAAFELDLILAKARMGIELGGVVPEVGEGASVRLHVARHPLLDRKTCVPLSINLDEMDVLLITGPNTGGKTVAIKTVGLSV
ncbi:MAG: hypothetical protein JNM34_11085, partial [Chthonomonadaceae bacterium]|nr:hypothetical protein [Chthonomonadaceae bacterium]